MARHHRLARDHMTAHATARAEGSPYATTTPLLRVTGRVIWWNDAKGMGWLAQDGGGPDCFVHHTELRQASARRTLSAGQLVEFNVVETVKGPRATNVTERPDHG